MDNACNVIADGPASEILTARKWDDAILLHCHQVQWVIFAWFIPPVNFYMKQDKKAWIWWFNPFKPEFTAR